MCFSLQSRIYATFILYAFGDRKRTVVILVDRFFVETSCFYFPALLFFTCNMTAFLVVSSLNFVSYFQNST